MGKQKPKPRTDAELHGPPSPGKALRDAMGPIPEHSAPGAKRESSCILPESWANDPRLAPHQALLDDAMGRIHDWADLFDMVRVALLSWRGRKEGKEEREREFPPTNPPTLPPTCSTRPKSSTNASSCPQKPTRLAGRPPTCGPPCRT